MTLEVQIKPSNIGLSGSDSVTLPPSGRGVYVVEYAPAVIGESTGWYVSLIIHLVQKILLLVKLVV